MYRWFIFMCSMLHIVGVAMVVRGLLELKVQLYLG